MAGAGFAHGIVELAVEAFDGVRLLIEQRGNRIGRRDRRRRTTTARSPCIWAEGPAATSASSTITHVPSVPVTARATLKSRAGEKRVEILEARHQPRDFREALLDQLAVSVAQRDQRPVDVAATADLVGIRGVGPELELEAVVGQGGQPLDIVSRAPPLHRMHAAAVVADHPAERVVVVGRWIGAEGQAVRRRGVAQRIEDASGLHAREPRVGVDVDDVMEVAREVDAQRDVAALAGEAGPAAARDDRCVMLACDADRFDHLVAGARINDADRHLAVVRGVGRVERLGLIAEVDRGAKSSFEVRLERARRLGRVAVPFTQHLPVRRTRGEPRLAVHHTSSRTVSDASVSAVFIACGVPLASALAMCSACLVSIFGGSGGS